MSQAEDQHWADIKEMGSLAGMRLLLKAYQIGGKPLFQVFLFPVVLFFTVTHPLARKASLQYRRYMHAYSPSFPVPRPGHSFIHLWNFANTLLDKLAVWMGKITRSDVTVHHGEIIDDLLACNSGAVLLISHLGNFEICQALSESRPSLHLTVLQHTDNAQKFNQLLNKKNQDSRVDFMPTTELGIAQAIKLSEKLSTGHFVAISADRNSIQNRQRTLVRSFLGQPAALPSGPFVLACALQVPVLSVHCIKQAGRYHIYFRVLSDGKSITRRNRNARVNELLDVYIEDLEAHCVNAPWQWYNFYNFWQQSDPQAVSKSTDVQGV